jgi:predicted regulator of Ras-like GTPase activity (Roadblock/LC7/MglB family)
VTQTNEILSKHLAALMGDCRDIYGTVIATVDGHMLAARGQQGEAHSKQLAAMTSTLVALGDSVADVLGQGICRNVLVENAEGTVLVLHAGEGMVLMAAALPGAKLGMVLSHSRNAAAAIAEIDKMRAAR